MLLFSANLLFPSSPWWWCWGLQAAALPGADGVGGLQVAALPGAG